MKKIILKIIIGLFVLLIVGVIAASLFLDKAVKSGVEYFGPKLTKVTVAVDGVSISTLSGSGKIKGLLVGNPEGYKSAQAISVGSATLALKPTSLLSDKIVINKIEVISPEITFEGGLGGNNLSKILSNLEETTGGSSTNAAAKPEQGPNKKLQVDEFLISGAKINVQITGMEKSVPVVIPTISLSQLGTGPEGITVADLTKKVIQAIEKEGAKAAASAATDLGKSATEIGKELGKNAGSVSNVTKGLNDLFKKK
jgi:hypothetical protein